MIGAMAATMVAAAMVGGDVHLGLPPCSAPACWSQLPCVGGWTGARGVPAVARAPRLAALITAIGV